MKGRRIGSLEVPVVGLGGNNFGTTFFGSRCDEQQVTRIVRTALDAGVTLIDTAEEYSIATAIGEGHSEQLIGRALGKRRDEALLATKWLPRIDDAPEQRGALRIVDAVEGSLRRLGTDWIDLYQQHQPDPATPADEIGEALERLVQAGKVREVGCCNFDADTIRAAAEDSAAGRFPPFRSCQLQYNVLERPNAATLAAIADADMSILPYFPLASGLLTGRYRRGVAPPPDSRLGAEGLISGMLREGIMARRPPLSDERLATVERLNAYAADHGRSLLELAISWLAAQPHVAAVLVGASKPEHVLANASAADWHLTPADLSAIDGIVDDEA